MPLEPITDDEFVSPLAERIDMHVAAEPPVGSRVQWSDGGRHVLALRYRDGWSMFRDDRVYTWAELTREVIRADNRETVIVFDHHLQRHKVSVSFPFLSSMVGLTSRAVEAYTPDHDRLVSDGRRRKAIAAAARGGEFAGLSAIELRDAGDGMIEWRFDVPDVPVTWSAPLDRMREYVSAIMWTSGISPILACRPTPIPPWIVRHPFPDEIPDDIIGWTRVGYSAHGRGVADVEDDLSISGKWMLFELPGPEATELDDHVSLSAMPKPERVGTVAAWVGSQRARWGTTPYVIVSTPNGSVTLTGDQVVEMVSLLGLYLADEPGYTHTAEDAAYL